MGGATGAVAGVAGVAAGGRAWVRAASAGWAAVMGTGAEMMAAHTRSPAKARRAGTTMGLGSRRCSLMGRFLASGD